MVTLKEFKGITKVKGVKNYILVRNDGKIAAYKIETPQYFSELVLKCGKDCDTIDLFSFRCLLFSRKNNENMYILPVGNYYLGVIKEKEIDDIVLMNSIFNFIKSLFRKRKKK